MQLHSDPYANLSQRIIKWACTNTLYALMPDLLHNTGKLPAGTCDIGENYLLLGPCEHYKMDTTTLGAFQTFLDLYNWRTKNRDSLSIDRFARLLLPNGQIVQSWWHKKKQPAEKVWITRNVKVSPQFFQRG